MRPDTQNRLVIAEGQVDYYPLYHVLDSALTGHPALHPQLPAISQAFIRLKNIITEPYFQGSELETSFTLDEAGTLQSAVGEAALRGQFARSVIGHYYEILGLDHGQTNPFTNVESLVMRLVFEEEPDLVRKLRIWKTGDRFCDYLAAELKRCVSIIRDEDSPI